MIVPSGATWRRVNTHYQTDVKAALPLHPHLLPKVSSWFSSKRTALHAHRAARYLIHGAFALKTIADVIFSTCAGSNARTRHVAYGKFVAAAIFLETTVAG